MLGSTGSIGTQTLDLIERLEGGFSVVGLGAGHWSAALERQVAQWQPQAVAVSDDGARGASDHVALLTGSGALEALVEELAPDVVVLGTPGLAGLAACIAALRQGAVVLVANKETLVSAGAAVQDAVQKHHGSVIPVDSEHSGIWQCLRGENMETVVSLVLTSSGGGPSGCASLRIAWCDRGADAEPPHLVNGTENHCGLSNTHE